MAQQLLTSKQSEDLLTLERVTSIFSVVGCLFIFTTFLFSKKFRRPVNRLIFYASWGNLLMNIATLMATDPIMVDNPKESPLCRFQGFLIQVFLPADAFWNLSMAINVYLTVYHKWTAKQLKKLEPFYLAFNYGAFIVIALVFMFINEQGGDDPRGRMYGPATLWCWVAPEWEDFRIWLCYLPAWIAILAIFIIYAMAWRQIGLQRRAISSSSFGETDNAATAPGHDIKSTEIRVTTELSRHSFVTPIVSPHMPVDVPDRNPSRVSKQNLHSSAASTSSISDRTHTPPSYVFNPFRLDPTCNLGFTPYSVTIERADVGNAAERRRISHQAHAAAWAYTQTALLYFISLLITWVPSSMNRVYSLVHREDVSFTFSVMAGLVLPLMGFWNVVIYIFTSWDAVVALFSDLSHGRVEQFSLPRMGGRRRRGESSVVDCDVPRSRTWAEIGKGGKDDDVARSADGGSEMHVVSPAGGARRQSMDTDVDASASFTTPRRSRDNGSVSTTHAEPSWPFRSKQEEEFAEYANR